MDLSQKLESIQKRAVSITMGSRDIPYEKALEVLGLPSLPNSEETLIMSFGKFLFSKSQHHDILLDQPVPSRTRKQYKLVPVKARTNQCGNSFVLVFVKCTIRVNVYSLTYIYKCSLILNML